MLKVQWWWCEHGKCMRLGMREALVCSLTPPPRPLPAQRQKQLSQKIHGYGKFSLALQTNGTL